MKKISLIALLTLVFSLTFAASPALAKSVTKAKSHKKDTSQIHSKYIFYKGTVTAIDSSSISLTLVDGAPFKITLDTSTRFHTTEKKNSTLGNITPGYIVLVRAVVDKSGAIRASDIYLVSNNPAHPGKKH